jgi:hypothetical protein
MVQDPVIEKLVQSAVARCRERIASATKRIDRSYPRSGETEIPKEAPSFTDALRRLRGL